MWVKELNTPLAERDFSLYFFDPKTILLLQSETHSGLDGDTDSADADDEFECDCIHCQQMRDVFSHRPSSQGNEPETAAAAAAAAATAIAASSSPLPTSTASVLLNTGSSGSLSSEHNDWWVFFKCFVRLSSDF